jgi:hypothetical protein
MGKKTIVTEYEGISIFSGAPAECWHHLISGSGLRKLADEDKLLIPLTNAEHNMSSSGLLYQIHENPTAEKLSKMLGQAIWEKEFYRNYNETFRFEEDTARKAFLKRYGISYL